MTKFETRAAAVKAAKAFIRQTLGWESGNGYIITDYRPYWDGARRVPGYSTAACRYTLASSDTRLI